jgi:hypothetical protein
MSDKIFVINKKLLHINFFKEILERNLLAGGEKESITNLSSNLPH